MLNNIEAERVKNQLTKEELAKKLNVSLKTYYNWINEDVDIPSKKLLLMSNFFGVSMEYLLGGASCAEKCVV
ncbi:helix-turn-helix transcriptional regulator [uncultured Bacteroides sp.]|uniref:helix-turn-helix domain-containing protein n=1 Tax=uncultured Bacteroides sp. TaxID=162156 RepID=UPI0026203281|nr:helix-turn-helix transcriptional regulator [uncultured Bacteroides sp.]